VRFYNAAGLVNELIKAQQEYRLSRLMTQLCKHELIVLDELGFIPFTATGAQLLFQFCSALLDRLTHRATIIEFVGTSFRFRQQLQRQELQCGKAVDVAQTDEEEMAEENSLP
jgi:hypothetical protein